jgi:superfamily II DNA or RNA helicase
MKHYCLKELDLSDRYATNRNNLITDFYNPCLECSLVYDRAVGYFRSSLLWLTAQPIADFAVRGGTIRLVSSPELTEDDINAFNAGYDKKLLIEEMLLNNIQKALEDAKEKSVLEFVATLISVGCLDIRIAFRPTAQGIFHDKVGILKDNDEHVVSFIGSLNETLNAWDILGNHESFDVFKSWSVDVTRVKHHVEYFESLWNGQEPGLETIPFPEVARERLIAIANPEGVASAYRKFISSNTKAQKIPQLHQIAAIEAWKLHRMHGILQHATGSGKTITAITAMRDWLKEGRPILVLVPSELLLMHWQKEIQSELGDLEIKLLLAGGGHTQWRKRGIIQGFTSPEGGPRIILATLQTASTLSFIKRVKDGNHLMLVIDEVHRAGSPTASNVLSINAGPRLGLSATPIRYGDPNGTDRILNYFEGIIDPPFTLDDAIASGRLCNYTYHIHPVYLNEEEMDKWRYLTKKIKQQIASLHSPDNLKKVILPNNTKMLLIRRADILKNAQSKISLSVEVLQKYYAPGQRWLIYCDDQSQLQAVLQILKQSGFPCDEYHSSMIGDQRATLNYFTHKGGIIVAIKCLDEGVDIPAVDRALILASSRNPREFIQRRGRILRTYEGKFYAEIHDALVVPPEHTGKPDDLSILRGELVRAAQFVKSATNEAAKFQLRQIARDAGIELEDVFPDETEYEDE